MPQLPANTYLNLQRVPAIGALTVILYDALNTLPTDQAYGHEQLLKFIKDRPSGTRIAIFVLGSKLHLLQGSTEDTDLLSAAVASKKGNVQTTTVIAPSADVVSTPISDGDDDLELDRIITQFRDIDKLDQEQLQDDRVEITLNALTEIGEFFSSLQGRKNLIWLSSSFPAGILPDETLSAVQGCATVGPQLTPFCRHDQSVRDYSEQTRRATDCSI